MDFFESQSFNKPNANSFLTDNLSTEPIGYQNKPNPLDYFNDSNKRNNNEEYFPFGRPGGGAPVRDSQGQIVSKRPGNQFASNSDSSIKIPIGKPQINWTHDQQRVLRDQQKDEWKKSLLEQVQEKERIKQAEKNRKILEEKKEEEKIANQLHELEKQYKREIRGEQGLPYEQDYYSSETKSEEKFEKPKISEKKTEKIEKLKENPQPVIREIESLQPKASKKYEFNPIKFEYWKAKSELAVQHGNFKDVIDKLRYDADQAQIERNEAMIELDRFRDSLKMRTLDNDLKTQYRALSQNVSYNPSLGDRNNYYINSIPKKDNEIYNKVLNSESKFVPLVSAGHSVIGSFVSAASKSDYEDIESTEVKNQLAELDLLLNYRI